MTKISGIYTPNIVPFNDDHSINEGDHARHDHLLPQQPERHPLGSRQ